MHNNIVKTTAWLMMLKQVANCPQGTLFLPEDVEEIITHEDPYFIFSKQAYCKFMKVLAFHYPKTSPQQIDVDAYFLEILNDHFSLFKGQIYPAINSWSTFRKFISSLTYLDVWESFELLYWEPLLFAAKICAETSDLRDAPLPYAPSGLDKKDVWSFMKLMDKEDLFTFYDLVRVISRFMDGRSLDELETDEWPLLVEQLRIHTDYDLDNHDLDLWLQALLQEQAALVSEKVILYN